MDIFDEMVEKWPSPVVARTEVKNFSGGLVHPKSLANLDSLGTGPTEKIVVGGKICYRASILADWLRRRMRK